MQALRKRNIRSGRIFDPLFPQSVKRDSVIKSGGKAKLHHTINLIKEMVRDTTNDTKALARQLKAKDLKTTCHNIWDFVYSHIQYTRDKAGVEQVRRPSRTWADRKHGVDCDCYSVFISSILTNLGISHQLRITKYGGKSHFQHIYPIVPTSDDSYITLDCVTDQFDYEVPFSGVRDFDMGDPSPVGEINGIAPISGVDQFDLSETGMGRISRGRMPLRRTQRKSQPKQKTVPPKIQDITPAKRKQVKQSSMMARKPATQRVNVVEEKQNDRIITSTKKIKVVIAGKVLLAVGVGFGTYKIIEILT